MEGILRNREAREITARLIILQFILLMFLGIFQILSFNAIKKDVIKNQGAMAGSLLKNHPELEEEIIPYITREVDNKTIESGLKTLSSYGYKEEMSLNMEPSIGKNIYPISLGLLGILAGHLILLLLLTLNGYEKMFDRVREISLSIQEGLKGNFSRQLREEDEGDFSILSHHYNNMLQMIKQNLETLNEERKFLKEIISDISHQLKTPMSSIMMLNELLIEDDTMEDKTREDFLNRTKTQLNRMNWLIKSLLKIARLEAKAITFKKERAKLIDVISGAVEPLRILAKDKNISIEVIDKNNSDFIGDTDWTSEAILNIVKNCIEHTKSGGDIKIELSSTPISSVVTIMDNGEGISNKDLPHIFERFYKGGNSTKDDSIGIGLAMSKSIIESQGGYIRVKSKIGMGTEFNITFLRGVI